MYIYYIYNLFGNLVAEILSMHVANFRVVHVPVKGRAAVAYRRVRRLEIILVCPLLDSQGVGRPPSPYHRIARACGCRNNRFGVKVPLMFRV
jgi:hypothetical protein